MVVLSYLAVDWFFVPPRRAFGRPSEFDVIILVGFLVTAVVVSQLVVNLRQTATLATARAEEIERLGAERLLLDREASRAEVLREAERLKDALIASLVHDLRSPITTMSMLSSPDSGVRVDTALQRIGDEVHRIDAFLSTLGRFTTGSHAAQLLVIETHVADDLIGTALRSTDAALQGHPVSTQTADTLVLLRCDFTLSLRIVGNLLENAARYSPNGAPIDIRAISDGAQVRIVVSDRGPGLAADEVDAVFRPLERGSAASSARSGSGMGLAIARTFAQAQRGDVVYAPRDGGGAQFTLVLPAASMDSESAGVLQSGGIGL
jgi:two-component system sensor histidine kinase KdpD